MINPIDSVEFDQYEHDNLHFNSLDFNDSEVPVASILSDDNSGRRLNEVVSTALQADKYDKIRDCTDENKLHSFYGTIVGHKEPQRAFRSKD